MSLAWNVTSVGNSKQYIMGLKDTLVQHKIPLPDDFDQRMDIVVSGLRGKSDYKSKLEEFNKQKGGADGDDWLGPKLNGVIDGLTTPAARGILQTLFLVVFFVKYLESMPVFGSIIGATLDVVIMGSKMLVKNVQKALPPLVGLLPLPYASMVGLGMAAAFGLLVWPILAIVSFSRADFTAAIDSFVRVVPPPIGDAIADTFLEANRTVSRLDEKRKKVGEDIANAFQLISEAVQDTTSQMKQGFTTLSDKTREAAQQVPQIAGKKKLTRHRKRKSKWNRRTRRHR